MKRFKFLLIPLIALGALTGCDQKDPNFCANAIDRNPTLIGYTSGKEVFTSDTKVINSADLTAYLGLTALKWHDTDFTLTWKAEPENKWSVSDYAADESHKKFMPLYGEEEFDCSLTLTMSAKGYKSATRKWNFHAAKHVKTDLSQYTYLSIKDLQEKYATDAANLPTTVYTYGKIVKTMKNDDQHLYTGVFIQDGEYGLQLYAGKLSQVWFAVGFEIGDTVMACGTLSPYNGLMEMKPDNIEYAVAYGDQAKVVAEPKVNDITDKPFTTAALGVYQTTMIKFDGLAYKRTKTKATSSVHGTYYFTKGETEIQMYVNYHLGEEYINQINALIDSLKVGDVVNFTGILTVYNEMQILPIDGGASFTKVA